jgi:predicted Rossmann-fold nucleotide-binding protein
MDWIKQTMLATHSNINETDLDLLAVVDTAQAATSHITDFYSKYSIKPNF